MDPIKRIQDDRMDARNQGDPSADLCVLALAANGEPSVRTLVLRDVTTDGFTLFINKTSPPWHIIQDNPRAEMLLWYTHSQTQYRIHGNITELDRAIVEKHWLRRPAPSKFLDHSYRTIGGQSSAIESRQILVGHIKQMRDAFEEEELTAPASATGILLAPDSIEVLDLNMSNRIHDRRIFHCTGSRWSEQQLVP